MSQFIHILFILLCSLLIHVLAWSLPNCEQRLISAIKSKNIVEVKKILEEPGGSSTVNCADKVH